MLWQICIINIYNFLGNHFQILSCSHIFSFSIMFSVFVSFESVAVHFPSLHFANTNICHFMWNCVSSAIELCIKYDLLLHVLCFAVKFYFHSFFYSFSIIWWLTWNIPCCLSHLHYVMLNIWITCNLPFYMNNWFKERQLLLASGL